MSDMIERASRAILKCLGGDTDAWGVWEDEAKAALKSLTPSDLAALAEPMGLALVPVTMEVKGDAECDCEEDDYGIRYRRNSDSQIYNSMIEAGRIKPKTESEENDLQS